MKENIKDLYINFFVSKGHKQIPSASVVPENDPTCLFNTAGMQPLVPYLLGAKHPQGTRLCNFQKCFRKSGHYLKHTVPQKLSVFLICFRCG
jgi:alanyl-tRNA synthetase